MATGTIKIRAQMTGDSTEVKALFKHDMETGLRKDKTTGEKIPAMFIKEVTCEHNGKAVFVAKWNVSISKDPYLSFKFKGAAKGDTIKISWVDSKGDTDSSTAQVA